MPYYWRRYRRRFRRNWRRRPRKAFRTRRFWRRRYRVRRQRKLKKIKIAQWQPPKINKLKITGDYPLFQGTNLRIGNDNTMYIDSVAPTHVPGGGLFSITVFSLKGLYELHLKARNWWTKSNCDMPLIKYTGCKLYLYRTMDYDYVTVYTTCGSLTASEQLFNSSQPSILLLNKSKKIVKCRNKNHYRKPYKVVKIRPPTLMTNQWYFQRELLDIPLVMIITSAMSLDRFYSSSNSISSTMGFTCLNTDFFQYHNFKDKGTYPYRPNDEHYLFTIPQHITYDQAQMKDLILLGNTLDMTQGQPIGQNQTEIDTYFTSRNKWGNPFYPSILTQELSPIIVTKSENLQTLKAHIKANWGTNGNKPIKSASFVTTSKNPLIYCRYNPQNDVSKNAIFLTNITTDKTKWHEPEVEKLVNKGLPLWLLMFGWTDWLKKSEAAQKPDTDYVLGIVSEHIIPHFTHTFYYVPVDFNFLHGKSPYEDQEGAVKDYDLENWHPKLNFQQETISRIINTGPATIKLPDKTTAEAHMKYCFYFKLGGCPPPMDNVCDPQKQPMYPKPGNLLLRPLLQNPEMPPEYYLYNWDERRGHLTERAAKRLKKDSDFKDTFFKSTGQTSLTARAPTPQTSSTEDSEEEEKSEETLQLQLRHQHRRQRKLRQRIYELLSLVQKLE